ncbi:hypothetical protein PSN45_003435 [Yamadazyma tenuis]|uniref:Tricalbin n=1 Tax=Candida tenuis (strain ATCC 10573 / BCRC 21748 / CBS 615 / JCM 9827 / NBRC 10315 / NRRL Y-1498 / VKM Y-70) TaxID=590646 RepID=G3AY59_CANTC|nr:uncharacterized protein CANTEDRAFT_118433 [Yamadazyma tenuis ATCC 10573]XP_006684895.1 tricalbin [Yamadazyma tenuis ATCC 10573]EGV66320.1 hypothetical protein CANTEDRAFT_118433 [Yamadazyma tenuis ATCC 10573]EGV66321.1 tricalbin [Yamadazyma tenuis ATCC 10573]WEJ95904.1 hypothetical protein PSN45_003435 [Yamadazyma tenuis]
MSEKSKDVPNGAASNIEDVKKYNQKVHEAAGSANPPMEGKATKPPVPTNIPSIRENTTFSWEDVGSWANNSSQDKAKSLQTLKKIENYVLDHFYGDWYWNTSIIIGTCFFSWLVARIGLGFFSLLAVLLAANSVYRSEFRRFNRDIRDDLTRIHASTRLEEELETMEWLNSFLDKFWVIYMPELSEQVKFIANEILKDQAPGMGIEKISLDEFTLGSKAPRVNSIKSYTRKGQDHIEMDWAFSFAPNDTDDMTKNEIKKKINPKVALGVTIGKAFISKSLPILVEDMSFVGRMNIKLKLTEKFPHVKMVSVQFLEAPDIDYSLKPVGGDTFGFDIMTFIPGLSSFVKTLIHSTLGPMLYAPNSLDVDVEEIMEGQSNDSNGCVAVTVIRCKKLKTGPDTKENSINPYVRITLSGNPKIEEKTKVKKAINDPIFLESKTLLVNKLDGNFLTFNVYDFVDDKPNDTLIGSVEVPLVDLLQKEVQTGLVKNISESGKTVGQIEFDLRYFPTLEPIVLDDGSKEENNDSEIGIVKLNLISATNLELTDSPLGLLNPYAEIYVDGELAKRCRRLKGTNNPTWNESFESLITSQSDTQIEILVKDSANEGIVARLDVNLQDIIFESSRGQKWIKCPPLKQGGIVPSIEVVATWKALGITDENVVNETSFGSAIGGLRLHIREASDLKNLEAVGEVDPYVKVVVNGKLKTKTVTIAETCDPRYDAVYFLPIDNEHQHLLLSIMDAEPDGQDRALGSCAVHVNDFIKKNEKGYFLGYDGSEEIIEQPVLFNGQNKGFLTYSVSFIPTIPIVTHKQASHKKEYQRYLKRLEEAEAAKKKKEEELVKDYPDKFEFIELDEKDVPAPPRAEMPLDDLIKYRAGTLSVNVLKGRFEKPDLYLQTLFDDSAFPSGVTPRNETRSLQVSSSAESFIRDLPNSNTIFRVAKRFEVKSEKDVIAEKTFNTLSLLKQSYNKPIDVRIDEHNTVKIQLEFIPTAVKLHPLDTVLDVGYMQLDILRGENLPAVDSNGKSDPMAIVKLDGVEVYKTDKKRKTISPVWNETANFPMASRSRQVLLVEVYDWDLTHAPELLGRALLDLSTVEPHTSTPFSAKLDTKGEVFFKVTFKPEYVRPPIGSAGGFPIDLKGVAGNIVGGAAGAVGAVGGGAIGAVGGGVGLAAEGLGKGGSFIKGFGKSKRKKKLVDNNDASESASIADSSRTGNADTSRTSIPDTPTPKDSNHLSDETSSTAISTASSPTKSRSNHEHSRSQYANDLQSLRSGSHPPAPPIKNALPNVYTDGLPAPQRPLAPLERLETQSSTPDSTVDSSFASSIHGANAIAGRLLIIGASGYSSKSLEVKALLKTPSKERNLFKTRAAKLDKKTGSFQWSESAPFQCVPESQIILVIREHHTFGSNDEVDRFTIDLSSSIGKQQDLTLTGSKGTLTINLTY